MIGRYPKAEKFALDLLYELCPSAQIEPFYHSSAHSFDYRLEFGRHRPSLTVRFDGDRFDDLEEALQRNGTSIHHEVLRNAVRFGAYISLGKAGLMPGGFPISEVLIKERGDWNSDLKVTTDFDEQFTRELIEGLDKLHRFLERHLAENQDLGEALNALRRAQDRIMGLLKFHQNHKHLNDAGATTETLMFFKAAIVAQILQKEIRKGKTLLADIRAAIDREIYGLVEKLRSSSALHVSLPAWLGEYRALTLVASQHPQGDGIEAGADVETLHVFLSHKHDDIPIVDAIKQCLEQFGVSAFIAHRDIVPSAKWRQTIVEHLQGKCNVFAPVLASGFHSSLWTDQETGIALQVGLPILPIKVDNDPYGFIDDRQAVSLKPGEQLKMCVRLLVGLGTQHPSFGKAVRLCLAKGLGLSESYDQAGIIAEFVNRMEPFSTEEAAVVLQAVASNRQVYESSSATSHLTLFLAKHRADMTPELVKQCAKLLGQVT